MRVLTVCELTEYIKRKLEEDAFLANVWVKGEISNLRAAVSGHVYFTLKDEFCCLRVVMFRSKARLLEFEPENGMEVIVRGYVSVYERDGVYQLYAAEIFPQGAGALYLEFIKLKEKLQREGLFDRERKKKIPLLPTRIGIVTSPKGAAVKDMLMIINRRWPGRKIFLVPVLVQGKEAPADVARGIELLNKLGDIDVIIVGRGGGSLEELWAFNTEVVARSIFNSRVPVISAVGHETDYTIADFVADLRAPTPSAAAEMAVPDKKETARYLASLYQRMVKSLESVYSEKRKRLSVCLASRVFSRPQDVLLGPASQAHDNLHRRLCLSGQKALEREKGRLAVLAGRLQALSPLSTLARGYSICSLAGKKAVLTDAAGAKAGDSLLVRLAKGELGCEVKEVFYDWIQRDNTV